MLWPPFRLGSGRKGTLLLRLLLPRRLLAKCRGPRRLRVVGRVIGRLSLRRNAVM